MPRASAFVALPLLAALGGLGCGTPPPASLVPDARAALARVHATQDCGLGIHASAKIAPFSTAK